MLISATIKTLAMIRTEPEAVMDQRHPPCQHAQHHVAFAYRQAVLHAKRCRAGCERAEVEQFIEEMFSAALLGLVEAERRFKPSLGYAFLTYAGWWIHSSMQKANRDEFNRAYDHQLKRNMPLRRNGQLLCPWCKDRVDDLDDYCRSCGREFGCKSPVCKSMDVTFGHDEGEDDNEVSGAVAEREKEPPPITFNEDDWQALLRLLIPLERKIIVCTYRDGLNYREQAKLLGVSRERIRQLHNRALGKMRDCPVIAKKIGAVYA